MFSSNKLSDQFIITQHKLGNGAFGSVYVAKINNDKIAVKCESKKSNNLTLIKEFKICRKIYMIKKYISNLEKNDKNENIENIEDSHVVKIYNYITSNNLLTIPDELYMNYINDVRCIPETFSYIECNDFNFLTMELCGSNFEVITEKYNMSERSKYFIAHRLLHTLSCIHRCGIIHRDIKLSNIVLNSKINSDNINVLYPMIIDLGLSKEYYKFEGNRVIQIPPTNTKSITGTLRYISLNVHEFKSPTIIDDIISLTYALIVIFTSKNLPWIGHKKDVDKFDTSKHTFTNCKCGYHKNKLNNDTKNNNTIAEVKFHTSLEELTENKYRFIIKWLKYLYSLKHKQLPSFNYLFKILLEESKQFNKLYLELYKK